MDHKQLIYTFNQNETQQVKQWIIIPKELDPNIQRIYGVENIVSDMLIRIHYTKLDQEETSIIRDLNQEDNTLLTR